MTQLRSEEGKKLTEKQSKYCLTKLWHSTTVVSWIIAASHTLNISTFLRNFKWQSPQKIDRFAWCSRKLTDSIAKWRSRLYYHRVISTLICFQTPTFIPIYRETVQAPPVTEALLFTHVLYFRQTLKVKSCWE